MNDSPPAVGNPPAAPKAVTIGILALQGCVNPHRAHLEAIPGVTVKEIRQPADFKNIDGIILPGGESTTMLKLLAIFKMDDELQKLFYRAPAWGICAGAILMAHEVSGPAQQSFDVIDIHVERNAYGRQLESFTTDIAGATVAFIRAPKILETGGESEIKASFNGDPVWVSQGKHMVTTFHPELSQTRPSTLHQFFVDRVRHAR